MVEHEPVEEVEIEEEEVPPPPPPIRTPVVIERVKGLPFPRLGEGWRKQCPWPLWSSDSRHGPFFVCGKPVKRGHYCETHGAEALTRPRIFADPVG